MRLGYETAPIMTRGKGYLTAALSPVEITTCGGDVTAGTTAPPRTVITGAPEAGR